MFKYVFKPYMCQMEKSFEVDAAEAPTSVLDNDVDVGGSDLAAGRNADNRRRNSLAAGGADLLFALAVVVVDEAEAAADAGLVGAATADTLDGLEADCGCCCCFCLDCGRGDGADRADFDAAATGRFFSLSPAEYEYEYVCE